MRLSRKVRPVPVFICQNCGNQFIPKDKKRWHASPDDSRYPKYCGPACTAAVKKKGGKSVCTWCGVEIEWRNLAHLSQTKHPFCSQRCYGLWQRSHNKFYREVTSDFKTWNKNRKLALARDGYQCVDCGIRDKKYWNDPEGTRIEVHHSKPRGTDEVDDHTLANLISLCKKCHKNRHHLLEQTVEKSGASKAVEQ